MKTSEFLEAAKAEIEKGWCQRAFFKTSDGRSVHLSGDDGTASVCALGACMRVSYRNRFPEVGELESTATILSQKEPLYNSAICVLSKLVGNTRKSFRAADIWKFNDNSDTTKEDVLKLFDDAIAVAKEHERRNMKNAN